MSIFYAAIAIRENDSAVFKDCFFQKKTRLIAVGISDFALVWNMRSAE